MTLEGKFQFGPGIDLAVILVNYERPLDTIECIHSLLASNFPFLRIVLVDNGSKDDSVELLAKAFPEIKPVLIPDNINFVGGYNTGIDYAVKTGATHIFVLNNDTIVEPGTIQELISTSWDVSVPKIVYYDYPEIIWSAGARWRRFPPSVIMIGYQQKESPIYDVPERLYYATGCAFIAKREVFESVGNFDFDFGNYMEDYDFFYRVGTAGFETGYVPSARILHKVSRTLGRVPTRQRYFIGRNTVLFYRKDNRFQSWKLWSYIFWNLIRETIKGNISHLPDYWRGYMDGFKWTQKANASEKSEKP